MRCTVDKFEAVPSECCSMVKKIHIYTCEEAKRLAPKPKPMTNEKTDKSRMEANE
ncbi:hypothetical protein HPP92_004494 [Vanilla planifolia]|uniref:Uncharacterized protein n=1 Tax=Vanilla planifolia TaxID=51239 RepID=A0A835S9I4_VANPL|nr:hypothetical protein HPP92_004494 [Vanilla planifolia]